MNEKLKAVLQIGKVIAPIVFPASGPAIAITERFIKHEGDVAENVADAAQAAAIFFEGLKGKEVVDEVGVRASVVMMEAAIKLMHDSVKEPA